MHKLLLSFTIIFILGWMANIVYSDISSNSNDIDNPSSAIGSNLFESNKERASPADRISEEQIKVYNDKVIINIDNPEWSRFTDTNSMDPVLDMGANAIHIVPKDPSELIIGDIVAYESNYAKGTIIHRIIEISEDEEGIYYVLKGDNNPQADPGKVRFHQIKRVLVAIIY